MPFLTDDKECACKFNQVQSGKVKVASVKHLAGRGLIDNVVHEIDIMNLGIGDTVKCGNLSNNIYLSMKFDSGLSTPEFRPAEDGQAKVNGGRVNSINPVWNFKRHLNP
jgi:hypothetical protein